MRSWCAHLSENNIGKHRKFQYMDNDYEDWGVPLNTEDWGVPPVMDVEVYSFNDMDFPPPITDEDIKQIKQDFEIMLTESQDEFTDQTHWFPNNKIL